MDITRALVRAAGWTAAGYWLVYTVGKVYMASRGEIGMPGRPAPPEAYADIADPALAQLGNAALGLAAAGLALAAILPAARGIPRPVLLGALTIGAVFTVLGLTATLMHSAPWPETVITAIGAFAFTAVTVAAYRRAPGTATAAPPAARAPV
ncbi:hypothetical protein [Murinocardiopsis flavida]|nr:hypothetical protein [Murinocardiopsis flavida]